MPIKSVKNENFEKQGSLDPKIRFLGQKVCDQETIQYLQAIGFN